MKNTSKEPPQAGFASTIEPAPKQSDWQSRQADGWQRHVIVAGRHKHLDDRVRSSLHLQSGWAAASYRAYPAHGLSDQGRLFPMTTTYCTMTSNLFLGHRQPVSATVAQGEARS